MSMYKTICFKKNHFAFLLAIAIHGSGLLFAQSSREQGFPLITNHSFKDYDGAASNWAILQGDRGKIYAGNETGLLEYDGITLRRYPLPNQSVVRSLAQGDSSKIYTGGVNELGYFQPDAAGQLSFHSLKEKLPAELRDFADVWQTVVLQEKVYFNVTSHLLMYDLQKKAFSSIASPDGFHIMFQVNDKLFIREWGKGLCRVQGDSVTLVPGGEQFAEERIYVMLPFPGDKENILVGTRTMGLFKYNGQQFTPFKTGADQFIKDNQIYLPGTLLQDGYFLLGTYGGGAVVMDSNGRMQRYFNKENGVIDNTIYYSTQDRAGNIWLATGNGISSISYASPATYFDGRNQLNTRAYSLIRHQGKLYLAGNSGLHYLDPNNSTFTPVKNAGTGQYFALAKAGNTLLAGGNEGLFKIEDDARLPIRKTIANEYAVNILTPSRIHSGRVYVGANGLWAVRQAGHQWIDEGNIIPSDDVINNIEEMADGSLWLSTSFSGIYRVRFARQLPGSTSPGKPEVEQYGTAHGLQDGASYITTIKGIPYFNSPDSLYVFDERSKRFVADLKDPILAAVYRLANGEKGIGIQLDSLGRLWVSTRKTLAMGIPGPDGAYTWDTKTFRQFAYDLPTVYAEPDGVTWMTGTSSLIRYDFGKKTTTTTYDALVSRVNIGGDSTIYFGALASQAVVPRVAFADNAMRFSFAATSYGEKGTLQFQTFLDGFDKGWSAWTKEHQKEYTNLPPGDYTFRVRAVNALGQESSEASYAFEILPPWYRTWWAYALWALLLGMVSYGFVRMQQARAVAREKQHSAIREANLKADAENERRKNIELISEMGQDITSSLSIQHIIETVYAHVNKLMDASVFGIGIINKDKQQLDFPATKEKGDTLSPYSYRLDDDNRPASWCYNKRKELFINDYEEEHADYVTEIAQTTEGGDSASLIYLPLVYKDKAIGVITAQSFSKNAYTEYHLNVLRSLATYTAVALDNADAYRQLQATQAQLIQSEKMASLGELTAGIAHEIQNPLNFVNNFSEVSKELLGEMKDELAIGNWQLANEIASDVEQNLEKIHHHGKRADAIVKGMLQHSRSGSGKKEPTDINTLCDEYLRLAYHGLKAKDNSFNASFKTEFEPNIGNINIVPQDIGRVLLNLINNGFYAVAEKSKSAGHNYQPTVTVSTKQKNNAIEISVADNGNGIPEAIKEKIFQPFFTTKPTGQGTGLGLSLSYDIVKAHGGELSVRTPLEKVVTKEAEGSEFIIQLPNN